MKIIVLIGVISFSSLDEDIWPGLRTSVVQKGSDMVRALTEIRFWPDVERDYLIGGVRAVSDLELQGKVKMLHGGTAIEVESELQPRFDLTWYRVRILEGKHIGDFVYLNKNQINPFSATPNYYYGDSLLSSSLRYDSAYDSSSKISSGAAERLEARRLAKLNQTALRQSWRNYNRYSMQTIYNRILLDDYRRNDFGGSSGSVHVNSYSRRSLNGGTTRVESHYRSSPRR